MHVGDVNILSISSCMGILSFLFSWQFVRIFKILFDYANAFNLDARLIVTSLLALELHVYG